MTSLIARIAALLLVLWFPIGIGSAHAAEPNVSAATEQVRATLIASTSSVHPGQSVTLGVQQIIIPHWHTYWINPGDSGLATRIDWALPEGAKAGAIQWPLPSRFDVEGITNYGYADEVTLLTDIVVPNDAAPGTAFPIRASVNWLVCAELCIPQRVDLALVLPVVAPSAAADEPVPAAIENARALLPQASPWPLRIETSPLQLRLVGAGEALSNAEEIWFYADTWGRVQHNAAQSSRREGADIVLALPAGESPATSAEELSGLLVVAEKSDSGIVARHGFSVGPAAAAAAPQGADELTGLLPALALALLGGIVLNLMPCVFPVLSIKALSLLHHATQSRGQIRAQGLVYTGGVLASFALLAAILLALKAGGTQIGWGFQYQSPLFVVAVAYLLFAVGLNLSGVFSFGNAITGVGSSLAEKPGYRGSFFSGVLAAIVATPCTAPFMGAAIGYALAQPPLPLLAVFLSLGFGLALPYLLLAWWPALQRRLPRPGAWMEWLKQLLAFPMYIAAVWLLWVLAQQRGADAVALALLGLIAIAAAAWLYQHSRSGSPAVQRVGVAVALCALTGAAAFGYRGTATAAESAVVPRADETRWENYSPERLAELRANGKPVFVNFTASWCISCLVNERVALAQPAVLDAFQKQNITYLKGDWTNRDNAISAKLSEFGRSGVPLYLFFPRGIDHQPIVLPQLLTPEIVLSAITPAQTAASF